MKRIEASPFTGEFQGFGRSYDSVAGILRSRLVDDNSNVVWRKNVLKWNRQDIPTAEEAKARAQFRQRSRYVYRHARGSEFITPTNIVIGNKQDKTGQKYKVYQTQPFIDGWTSYDAPEEVREHHMVLDQWFILSTRLFHLYQVADRLNKNIPEEERFLVTITVGSSRQQSLCAESSAKLPITKNIMIKGDDLRLQLFDFGEYVLWHDGMQDAYDRVMTATSSPQNVVVFESINHACASLAAD